MYITLFELLNASSTNVKYSSKSLYNPVGKIKYMEEPTVAATRWTLILAELWFLSVTLHFNSIHHLWCQNKSHHLTFQYHVYVTVL